MSRTKTPNDATNQAAPKTVKFDYFHASWGQPADTTAPVTTATTNPANPNGAGWFGAPVTVTLAATDGQGSGVDRTEQRRAVARFLTALRTGDLQGLMDALAPDAVLIADGGGVAAAVRQPPIAYVDITLSDRLIARLQWEQGIRRRRRRILGGTRPGRRPHWHR